MEILKQRRLNIQRDYTNKRSKIEEQVNKTTIEYETHIFNAHKKMKKDVEALENEEREALKLAESQVMKKLISDAILRSPDISFEDADGNRWKPRKFKWSDGSYIREKMRSGGNSWHGDTFDSEHIVFTPEMIESELKENHIDYDISDDQQQMVVFIIPSRYHCTDFIRGVIHPKMIFYRY